MKIVTGWITVRAAVLLCPALLGTSAALAHSSSSVISLDPAGNAPGTAPVRGEASFANPPANFRSFPAARVGESSLAEQLTLRFAASTELTRIDSTRDFTVEPGGTCATRTMYASGASCTLLVRFTPQGPGPRLGKLTITHTAAAQPAAIGLGGNGYAPVVSFTPAVISTVSGTFAGSKGLLSAAQNLTVDGGDSLYIADTGNNIIRYMDSSGNITTLASGYSAPNGIAVDTFGEVYFDLPAANSLYEIYDYGPVVQANGTTTGTCPAATPCVLSSHALSEPGTMSMDLNNRLFFADADQGAALATVQPVPANLIYLYDPFPYQTNPPSPVAVDASDNLYSFWTAANNNCEIVRQALFDAENSNVNFTKIVGGHTCGFSGDGGEAGNAEIGARVGQMAFDVAGNFYFSDSVNQRVRRIDAATGIINTIAGTGTAGYSGDSGAATSAQLSSPSGVAVDSQGQVYVISSAAATGTAQVVRKLGPNGLLSFGAQLRGSASAAHLVTVANTGNSALTLTNAVLTGTNPGDFSVDPDTTSCDLSAEATLNAGQSCKVGILFKPAAAGARSANLVLLDNTVTNSNTVQLTGTGTLPAPTFVITSPPSGTSVKSGTAVIFAVSVTSTSSPAPTGTVKFSVNGTPIGSAVTLSSGKASVSVTETTVGTYNLSATYSGDANYAAAGPITRSYNVTAAAAASKTSLASLANPTMECKPVEFSVRVTGTGGTHATGKVELKKGTTVLAAASLSNGGAKLSTSALTVGTNVLTASYQGDARNRASTSAPLSQVILSSGSSCSGMVLRNPL